MARYKITITWPRDLDEEDQIVAAGNSFYVADILSADSIYYILRPAVAQAAGTHQVRFLSADIGNATWEVVFETPGEGPEPNAIANHLPLYAVDRGWLSDEQVMPVVGCKRLPEMPVGAGEPDISGSGLRPDRDDPSVLEGAGEVVGGIWSAITAPFRGLGTTVGLVAVAAIAVAGVVLVRTLKGGS